MLYVKYMSFAFYKGMHHHVSSFMATFLALSAIVTYLDDAMSKISAFRLNVPYFLDLDGLILATRFGEHVLVQSNGYPHDLSREIPVENQSHLFRAH